MFLGIRSYASILAQNNVNTSGITQNNPNNIEGSPSQNGSNPARHNINSMFNSGSPAVPIRVEGVTEPSHAKPIQLGNMTNPKPITLQPTTTPTGRSSGTTVANTPENSSTSAATQPQQQPTSSSSQRPAPVASTSNASSSQPAQPKPSERPQANPQATNNNNANERTTAYPWPTTLRDKNWNPIGARTHKDDIYGWGEKLELLAVQRDYLSNARPGQIKGMDAAGLTAARESIAKDIDVAKQGFKETFRRKEGIPSFGGY